MTVRASAARRPVITGLGMTEMGRVYGRSPADFAGDAVRRAAADAGLGLDDIDGLLLNPGLSAGLDLSLAKRLGLRDLRILSSIQSFGASAGAMVSYAAMAVNAGMAHTIACVYADAPLQQGRGSAAAYSTARVPAGFGGLTMVAGFGSINAKYAVAVQRHMQAYGTTSEQLGAIAVAQRAWAVNNPLAQMREPITLADHQNSRMIVDPLHLLDCCLVTNGAVAVIVTAADRAADSPHPAVHVLGIAQSHPNYLDVRGSAFGLSSGAAQSGPAALKMAGVTVADIDIAQIYDCYTFTVLITLEDYGFCAKGEGGPFAASGALAPGGSLAVNTGGGQLSSYYMWGMTPLSEAIIQARGEGGERQAPRNDVIMVSGNGGILEHHSTLVLSPHAPSSGV